jgi:MoxR-like ATPase
MLERIQAVAAQVGSVVVGKQPQIRLALACLLSRGHLLIEDLPGVGKTTLAQALAISLGLQFKRVQFTNDLLPSDIVGVSVYERDNARFVFHPGPVFSQVLLADEINRASPKTQSALLEAMEERQVSVDGEPRRLPDPFFVIATQNPQDQIGTFPLPESQLDRFLMRIELGVPDRAAERAMLLGEDRREMLRAMQPVLPADALAELQAKVRTVHTAAGLLDYLQDLLDASRRRHRTGLSPRAGLALLHAAQAWALMEGREMVLPEDVQAVGPAVMAHRLGEALESAESGRALARNLLREVAVP